MKKSMLSIILLVLTAPAAADQNDARLDALFAKLKQTTDLPELRSTEMQIWEIWTDSGRADINALMEQGIDAMQQRNYNAALEKFDEGAGLVVRAAVEGHVLKEVGEAALVIGFVEGTGEDDEAEAGALLGLVIGEDDVVEAVGQLAEAGGGVGFQIAALVGEAGCLGRSGGGDAEDGERQEGENERGKGEGVEATHGGE